MTEERLSGLGQQHQLYYPGSLGLLLECAHEVAAQPSKAVLGLHDQRSQKTNLLVAL